MTPQLQRYYRLGASKGVLISNVVENGPADQAGLTQGDIVTQINGASVNDPYDVERILAKLKPTDVIHLTVIRQNGKATIQIKLQELPKLDNLPQGIF